MNGLDKIIANISVTTGQLSYEQIQDVMINSRRCKNPTENDIANWNQIAEILWSHINIGLEKADNQLLCTTCFFSVLIVTDKQKKYMKQINEIIQNEINTRCGSIKDTSKTFLAVSLMYGIFQSSFLTQDIGNSDNIDIINSTFRLLSLMGYEYSQYTAIAFKIMNSFKKVCGTDLQPVVFSEQNQIILLNLINHNWENPITGVRDLNKDLFQTLLTVLDGTKLKDIVQEINSFYWNKAKYLMLSEVIHSHSGDIMKLIIDCNIIEGLVNSLHKPGLVSAGTDIYFAILNKIHTEEMWCKIFLCSVIEVLNGSSSKAIENFTNYWCVKTFKQFPTLLYTLIGELEKFDDTELKLYSIVSILKQGSKLAILNINWNSTDNGISYLVETTIEHCSTQIRMLAFDVICLSQYKRLPSQKEYTLILEYIKSNINSDCTVLRLNMFNSFSTFFGQIHLLFRNLKENEDIEEREYLFDFSKNLQHFIVTSVNSDGNYQRKTTNVKLIKIMIDSVSEVPKKKKNYTRSDGLSLREYLNQNDCWILHDNDFILKLINLLKDPSDDIRENVGNLLLSHYSEQIRCTDIFNNLIKDAQQSMKSKFFFEISCGQSMFKLLVNLLLKKKHPEAIFKSIDDVFNHALNDLLTHYVQELNALISIEDGKQLHSFLNIIQVVLDVSLKNSYKLVTSECEENMDKLLNVLKGITDQFTFEQQNATSSDFSKMNEVVEDIIAKAGYDQNIEKDKTKISGLHQIVLNCLWLNVKASCDLASLLIHYNKDNFENCEKCLTIITHVLETSRHKGAIESAGAALGSGIQFLTSLPVDSQVAQLPQTLLKTKLHTLILEASKMASITRRGAGLSIMVHRIVSSDMRKGKPLFHYFIKTLLKTCQDTKDVPLLQDDSNIENQMDLPKAILIHFLSRIVTDSSLASDMMFYSAELGELAFSNLTSPHWQIRNAALQLYGALIPKLIGQRKQSGTDDEVMATVAYDELRTHSPKLWKFITEQMKNEHYIDKINSHSNFVPILNMLASCARRYNFLNSVKEQAKADEELMKSLIRILDSPIHTVRRLTSKCIFNIFTPEIIYGVLINLVIDSENLLHGVLLLLKNCHNYLDFEQKRRLHGKFHSLLKNEKHCYWSKEVFASVYPDDIKISDLHDLLSELNANKNSPGVFVWAQTCIKSCIMGCQWEDIPRVLDLLLLQNLEICYDILLCKLETQKCPQAVLRQIANSLLSKCFEHGIIWKIMYKISQEIDLNDIDFISVFNFVEKKGVEIPSKISFVIPFIVRFIGNFHEEHQGYLVDIIKILSDFEYMDVDMRYIAALSNNELAKSFAKVSVTVKVSSIKIAIMLLQDEDEDVRNASIEYYIIVQNLKVSLHPSITLNRMLDYNFLYSVLGSQQKVAELCEDLLQLLSNNVHKNTDEYNPFANDSKNIYLEVNVLRTALENVKLVTSHQ